MYLIYMLILISSAFSMDVVTIGGRIFSDKEFFNKYGRNEWDKGDDKQKNRMLNDYIKREACEVRTFKIIHQKIINTSMLVIGTQRSIHSGR